MNPILKTIHASLVCSILLLTLPARAQITPDTTLGNEASRLTPNQVINGASADRINGGAQRGINLFHSFSQFNIGDGQRVYFGNPAGVENILTRVTGASASNILGTLGVDGAANLFLINPNGILFGQNARLDVRGSFVGTTANGVKFGDLGVFDVGGKQAPALLTINPSALLFNQINSGAITANQSVFNMRPGQNLTLVGGNIQLNESVLGTLDGRIEITAVGLNNVDSKTIELNSNSSLNTATNISTGNISLNETQVYMFGGNGVGFTMNAGNIDISGNSYVALDTRDNQPRESKTGDITLNATDSISIREGSQIDNSVFGKNSANSGDIKITTGSLLLTDDALLRANVYGQGNAGNIIINARDQFSLDKNASVSSNVRQTGIGNGGSIIINTNSFSATDNSELSASTYGKGNTGDIILSARNISLSNDASVLNRVQQTGIGLGGNISINTETLSLTNEASVQTFSFGLGSFGDVIISASNQLSLDTNANISTFVGDYSGGNIKIDTRLLPVINSEISTRTIGKGKAGDITISASNRIDINGKNSQVLSRGSSNAGGSAGNILITTPSLSIDREASIANTVVDGNGGSIQIDTGLLSVVDGEISTYTFGKGKAGDITIDARNRIDINAKNSQIISQVSDKASGNSGNIVISTLSLFIDQEAKLGAVSFGRGNTGNIIINADKEVFLDNAGGIYNDVYSDSIQGGDIRVSTQTLKASNLARVQASTSGKGSAGNTIINSSKIELSGSRDDGNQRTSIGSFTYEEATGNGGNVEIITNTLSLKDGALVGTDTFGQQSNAGILTINARDGIFIDYGDIFSRVNQNAVGNGGDILITTGILELKNGSQIDASTFGDGDAGNINIIAKQPITVVGIGEKNKRSSAIFSTTGDNPAITGTGPIVVGKGKGGNIIIEAPQLTVSDGGVIDARTFNDKPGGNINLTLDSLQLLNGGQIFTISQSSGEAGTITINAKNQVDIAGSDPTYSNRLSLFPRRVAQISPNSGLYVRATESGAAGNINLTTARLNLTGKATINAESNTVDGGNINLNVNNVLVMRKESTISATAGIAQGAGNGGNININAGAIVAVPRENSDIRANAFEGRGGNVNINTDGLFGIAASPFDTSLSDITASSTLGVQGQILIQQPDIQPTQGLIELPEEVIDATRRVAQICPREPGAKPLGEFTITGRGSLPPSPLEPLTGTTTTRTLATLEQGNLEKAPVNVKNNSPTPQIVEAQGWVKTADGGVELVAAAPSVTPNSTKATENCSVVQSISKP